MSLMSKVQKIFIVDDHEIFRKGLSMVINRFDFAEVIGEASNGEEFLQKLSFTVPDIIFMDIKMPIMNGIDATEKAIEMLPDLKIVALSMFGEEEYLHKMLNAGAMGFLLKKSNIDDIENAIKLVANGNNTFSNELLGYFTKKFFKDRQEKDELENAITKRELEVLALIAQGFTNQEIADELCISKRTVDGHKANMIVKTGSKNMVNLLVYAIKHDLVKI